MRKLILLQNTALLIERSHISRGCCFGSCQSWHFIVKNIKAVKNITYNNFSVHYMQRDILETSCFTAAAAATESIM